MKNIISTMTGLTLLSLSSMTFAAPVSSPSMHRYDVVYHQNTDLMARHTAHALQNMNYQHALDIYSQVNDNIAYIGARLHLHEQVAMRQDEQFKPKRNPSAQSAK